MLKPKEWRYTVQADAKTQRKKGHSGIADAKTKESMDTLVLLTLKPKESRHSGHANAEPQRKKGHSVFANVSTKEVETLKFC
jgi:hypothetical protein